MKYLLYLNIIHASFSLEQERYRSNSLDSVLVGELNGHPAAVSTGPNGDNGDPVASAAHTNFHHRLSAVELKSGNAAAAAVTPSTQQQQQQQQHALRQQQLLRKNLEKRPTFDSLDKRKSWSVDVGSGGFFPHHQRPKGRNVLRNAKGQTLQQVQQQQKQQQQKQQQQQPLLATSKG